MKKEEKKIKIERGQIWRVDDEFAKSLEKFRSSHGDNWTYHNEVLILQNTSTITPAAVFVVPISLSSNSIYDIPIPLKAFSILFKGYGYAKTVNMFSLETDHLTKCICQLSDEKMKEFDDVLNKILMSGE